jgi:hypothetical protein
MKLSRRSLLKAALGMPAAAWLLNYRAIAAPHTGQVKITKIKTLGSSVTAKPGFLQPPPARASKWWRLN